MSPLSKEAYFEFCLIGVGILCVLRRTLSARRLVLQASSPLILWYIADTTGSMAIAFLIPLVCYGVIGGYAAMPRYSSTGVERGLKV